MIDSMDCPLSKSTVLLPECDDDITMISRKSPVPSSTKITSSSTTALSLYFQELYLELNSSLPSSEIIIVSDNHATHDKSSSSPLHYKQDEHPEYERLDDFMPSFLKEKGITNPQRVSIVSDNATSQRSICENDDKFNNHFSFPETGSFSKIQEKRTSDVEQDINQCFSPSQSKSPLSVMDFCQVSSTDKLRNSFRSL